MELGESKEDYLEAVYVLKHKGETNLKSIMVAEYLNVSKPSVTNAMHGLEKLGYLYKNSEQELYLTEKGRVLGKKLYERHHFFKDLLISIGVEEKTAEVEACHMEHILSDNSFKLFKDFVFRETL